MAESLAVAKAAAGRSRSCIARAAVGGAIGIFAASAASGASVEGQVFEVVTSEAPVSQSTRQPSAGAYVIVLWQGTVPRFGHYATVCLHAAVGRTDEQGRFEVQGRWPAPREFPVIQREPAVSVYKPGFEQQSDSRSAGAPVARTLVRSKLAGEQRLALLAMYAESGCRDDDSLKVRPLGDPQGIAAQFYRALYEEAQTLGPIPPASRHYLATLRERAGLAPAAEPPWQVQILPRGGVHPSAPQPAISAPRPEQQ